jgi:murein DD-endopeptidase MepM/ murein hydrolase activator NlpD
MILIQYITNIYRKAKDARFHRDPRVVYCLVAMLMFVAGLFVGADFSKKDSSVVPTPVVIDQPQSQEQLQFQPQSQVQIQSQIPFQDPPLPVTNSKVAAPSLPVDNTKLLTVTVRNKDNLAKIFKRNGIDVKDAQSILALKQAKALRDLRVGKKMTLTIEKLAIERAKTKNKASTKLKRLVYVIDELNTLTVIFRHGWHAQIKHIEPTVKLSYASAIVQGSVYAAANKKKIPQKIVAQLSNIFSKKADFKKMRKGDSFAVFYKEYAVNGKIIKEGEVVAAEISHGGQLHRMIAFTDPRGNTDYYTPQGYNSNPPFARLPIKNYKHIGSRFSFNRRHPILGYTRPHLGVDFSAPHGTPIKATSSGRIEFVGNKDGHGRKIIIQRGIYKTLYAHLSSFANNIRPGSYVSKGETIGYVGQSGLATGPHLHYEFHINGTPHDPLKVKLPEGEMILPEYRKKFFALAKNMLAQLDMHRNDRRMLAINEVYEPWRKESSV